MSFPSSSDSAMGYTEDKTGPGGQTEDRCYDTDHKVTGAEDESKYKDGVEHGGDDVIVDPETDNIEMDNGVGPRTKDGHSLGVGGNTGGWWHSRASSVSELTLQFQES